MITVLHVITGLRRGGAEQALAQLAMRSDRTRFRHIVAPLRDEGTWENPLRESGVELSPLHFNTLADAPGALSRLRRVIARKRPDLVQSWLYHADLLATLATSGSHRPQLIWSLRNTDLRPSGRASWGLLVTALAALSRRPDLVLSNSEAGLKAHIELGYKPRRTLVIPNGVDVAHFRPAPGHHTDSRRNLGLPMDRFLIGMPARLEGYKDHTTFVEAARLASAKGFSGAFALAGNGVDKPDSTLRRTIAAANLTERFHLLPAQADMRALYSALDLVTLSSSHGEGFPNVLAEAMACERPVVATDVGDVRAVLDDIGLVVSPRSPVALSEAWLRIAATPEEARAERAGRGREWIERKFKLEDVIARYERLYVELGAA